MIPINENLKFGKKLAAAFGDGSVYQPGHFPGCSNHQIGNYWLLTLKNT